MTTIEWFMMMQSFLLTLRALRCETKMTFDDLTESGRKLLKNSSYALISVGTPIIGHGRIAPTGMTLVSPQKEPPFALFKFEGNRQFQSKYLHFAPKVTLSPELLEYLGPFHFNNSLFSFYAVANLSILDNSLISMHLDAIVDHSDTYPYCNELEMEQLPAIYRRINGNFIQKSHSILNSTRKQQIEITEPLPKFCHAKMSSFKSTCKVQSFNAIQSGVRINLVSDNCSYSYKLRCALQHWSIYPQNPDHGFVIGPSIITFDDRVVFGNTENLILPPPDFSMVFNTPIIIGCIFSFTFATIIRKVLGNIRR